MYSLVMSPFSHDFTKMEVNLLKYQQCFNLIDNFLNIYSIHWFLDGRTSILVLILF